MKIILLIALSTSLFGEFYESIHSSISTYYEDKSYSNSKQKTSGRTYGVAGDLHYKNSEYKFAYENAKAITVKPPLSKDLEMQKIFLKYAYAFDGGLGVNVNYLSVLDDNIAITDGGKAYGFGATYKFAKRASLNFTQFHTDYEDFDVEQSDMKIAFKVKFDSLKLKLGAIAKYIKIDDNNVNAYTKNANSSYLTSGIQAHLNYVSYHLGAGAYFGKRAFAIMDDGFKVQHHAMEFDRTYALGFGKNIDALALRFQYIYLRATELPIQNSNVTIRTIRLVATYKF